MALKITQCIVPFVQQNKQNILQVFNQTVSSTSKNSYSTKIEKEGKSIDYFSKISSKKKFSTGGCSENLAAVLHGVKDLKLEKRPMPKISSNQVLLEMEVCGICGTDVHFYEDGKLGPWTIKEPIIIGHEASGTVKECGECVTDLKPGDKVAIEPQVPCRKCPLCKSGNYHMCPNLYFCAAPPHDGNLCRFFAHESDFCHKIPCNMDLELATLMEPLSVGVHACKKGHITSGDAVLILGSGPVGLASMLAARAYGASKVIILDIDSYKLKKAMEMGADCGINSKGVPEEEVVKKIHEVMGRPPNKTLDCCGFQEAIRVGILATDVCGKMVIMGLGQGNQCLPIMDSVYREIEIIGAIRYANDYATAIDMVASGKVDPKPLITHHFKLEDACEAFQFALKRENYIKIMVHTNPKWKPADGKYNMCRQLKFCAPPDHDGSLCRYFAHDANFCHKIPCHLDHEIATLMEPLSLGVHACKKAHITSGDYVLILGSGPIGITSMLAARAFGASSVVVLDIDSYKLRKALDMGADDVINCKGVPQGEIVKKVHDFMERPPNKTIECSGFQAAMRIGILATGVGGKMVLVGLGNINHNLPIMDCVYKEIDLIGSLGYCNDFETAINMVDNGKIDLRPMITHHFKLEDVCNAYEFAAKKQKYLKIMVHTNPKWKPTEDNC